MKYIDLSFIFYNIFSLDMTIKDYSAVCVCVCMCVGKKNDLCGYRLTYCHVHFNVFVFKQWKTNKDFLDKNKRET